jgi:hypothetical protein
MFLLPNNKVWRLPFFLLLILSFTAFTASAQSKQDQKRSSVPSQVRSGQTADVNDVVVHPEQYMGKKSLFSGRLTAYTVQVPSDWKRMSAIFSWFQSRRARLLRVK